QIPEKYVVLQLNNYWLAGHRHGFLNDWIVLKFSLLLALTTAVNSILQICLKFMD
ncbi:MAG: hypothetical protein RLZZ05_1627, partial [Bacteroidota bacterium]